MFDNLEVMRMATGLAQHASARQAVVARNVANADTPDYRAHDVAPFEDLYETGAAQGMKASREGHLSASGPLGGASMIEVPGQSSPNGNTVSLETEMMRSAEVRHQHDMATSIYKSSLDILRTSLGRR